MSWKRRLAEITLAGGLAVSASGCGDFFMCNANPDPCCAQPNSEACYNYTHPNDMSINRDDEDGGR